MLKGRCLYDFLARRGALYTHLRLIIILCRLSANDVLLAHFAPGLFLGHALGHAGLDPLPGRDTDGRAVGGPVVTPAPQHVADHGPELERVLGPDKVEDAQAVHVGLVGRRRHHAVDAALEEPVGQELERVGHVDRDAARVGLHPLPLALGSAHLQGADGLAEEQGETVVSVMVASVKLASISSLLFEPRSRG